MTSPLKMILLFSATGKHWQWHKLHDHSAPFLCTQVDVGMYLNGNLYNSVLHCTKSSV